MANLRFRHRDGAVLLTLHCDPDSFEPWPDELAAEDSVRVEPGERVTLAHVEEVDENTGRRTGRRRYELWSADGVPGNADRSVRRTFGWRGTTQTGRTRTTVHANGVWVVESVADRSVTLRYVGGRDDPPDYANRLLLDTRPQRRGERGTEAA